MKTFPIVAFLCYSMLFAVASAQELTPEQREQQQIERQVRNLLSPINRLAWEAERLAAFRAPWNGQGIAVPFRLMMHPMFGGANELGLTDEQQQRLSLYFGETGDNITDALLSAIDENTPEYAQAMEAVRATLLPDDRFFERATEEQKNAFREAETTLNGFVHAATQEKIQEILTPEQMLQLRKLEMQLLPVLGVPFPTMFEPLDLTDEQREEMRQIAEEMRAEYDQLILGIIMLESELEFSKYESLRGQSFASQEEFQQAYREIRRAAIVPETQRKHFIEHMERGIKFTTLLQTRLMNVLTDEQLDMMQEILDNTPRFAQQRIATFKMMRMAAQLSPTYIPGPDSWRPGAPTPIQIREERQRSRFPRSE